jgi:hypothetical protein
MSRDTDWEEEKPNRRMDRWGDEDSERNERPARAPYSGRSGAVTAAGIVTLILGSLVLLGSLCVGAGVLIAGADEMHPAGMGPDEQVAVLIALIICVLTMLWGVAAVASGIGVIGRRNWARVLTLILGGFGAGGGLLFLFVAVAAWFAPDKGGPERGMLIIGILMLLFAGLGLVAYCFWVYVVLLSSRCAAEFRKGE